MRESTVGLSHAVNFFFFLHNSTCVIVGIDDFVGQGFVHGNTLTATSGVDHPAESEGLLAFERNFNGHLISGATDAAALHFKLGTRVFKRSHNKVDWIALFQLFANAFKRSINDLLSHGALTAFHNHVYKIGNQSAVVARIWYERAFNSLATT